METKKRIWHSLRNVTSSLGLLISFIGQKELIVIPVEQIISHVESRRHERNILLRIITFYPVYQVAIQVVDIFILNGAIHTGIILYLLSCFALSAAEILG